MTRMTSGSSEFASHISLRSAWDCQSQLPLLAFLARAKVARAVASCHELALLPDGHELALLPAGHELAMLPAAMSCQPSRAKLA